MWFLLLVYLVVKPNAYLARCKISGAADHPKTSGYRNRHGPCSPSVDLLKTPSLSSPLSLPSTSCWWSPLCTYSLSLSYLSLCYSHISFHSFIQPWQSWRLPLLMYAPLSPFSQLSLSMHSSMCLVFAYTCVGVNADSRGGLWFKFVFSS